MRDSDEGHAVVDAMVALLILALTVTLSLQALLQAQRTSDRAAEIGAARALIDNLMAAGPRSLVPAEGVAGAFAWRVKTEATGAERPVEVCRRAVEVVEAESGRTYAAATLSVCPEATGA